MDRKVGISVYSLAVAVLLSLLTGCMKFKSLDPGNAQGYGGGDTVVAAVGRVSLNLARAARQIQAGEDRASVCRPQSCGLGNDPSHCQRLAQLTPAQAEACRSFLVSFAGQYAGVLSRPASSLVDVVSNDIEVPDGQGRAAVVTAKAPLGEDGKIQMNFSRASQLNDHALGALLTHEVGHTFKGDSGARTLASWPRLIRDEAPMPPFSNGFDFLAVVGIALDVFAQDHAGGAGTLDTAYERTGYKQIALGVSQFDLNHFQTAFLPGGNVRLTGVPSLLLPPPEEGEEPPVPKTKDFWLTPTDAKVELAGMEVASTFDAQITIDDLCAYGKDDARHLYHRVVQGEQSFEEIYSVRRAGTGGAAVPTDTLVEFTVAQGAMMPLKPMTCLPGGKTLVGYLYRGEDLDSPVTLKLQKFLATGARDTEFGTGGIVEMSLGQGFIEWIDLVPGDENGFRLFLRRVELEGSDQMIEMRFTRQGQLVTGFGQAGSLSLTLPTGWFAQLVSPAAPGGRYHFTGIAFDNEVSRIETLSYGADGTRATAFGDGGVAERAFVDGESAILAQQIVDTEGRIVISSLDEFNRVRLVRYLSSGKLDPRFGGNGIATLALPFAVNRILGMERQGDRLLVALLTIIREKYEVAYLQVHY